MNDVKNCPCSRINIDYPHEGMMTKHMCILKPISSKVCDGETNNGCRLFEYILKDSKLKDQILKWTSDI